MAEPVTIADVRHLEAVLAAARDSGDPEAVAEAARDFAAVRRQWRAQEEAAGRRTPGAASEVPE